MDRNKNNVLYYVYKILEKPDTIKYGTLVQEFLLINILINVFVVIASIFFTLEEHTQFLFSKIENITVIIFMIELVLRYISIGYNSSYKGIMGKIKFTFTFYTIIDILSILPYFIGVNGYNNSLVLRVLRFIRILRVLKLFRMKKVMSNFFSIEKFATSSLFMKSIILFVTSIIIIFIFKFIYSNSQASLDIFLSPSAISETQTIQEIVFGVIELVLGLFIGGALISIITETLVNITSDIKKGYYPYKGKNHIIIINHNLKLPFILDEINQYYKNFEEQQDIVLFLPEVNNIEDFYENIMLYSNLKIFVLTGDIFNWDSYDKLNINYAEKVLILNQQNSDIQNSNIKISQFLLSNENLINEKVKFIIESDISIINQSIFNYIFQNRNNSYILIDHKKVLENILNRSLINPSYFKIFSEILSYRGYEFYTLNNSIVFNKDISFKDAYLKLEKGLIVGLKKDEKIILNPDKTTIIRQNDDIILLLQNASEFAINDSIAYQENKIILDRPSLKENKKICIIGNNSEIEVNNIIQFITDESIKLLKHIDLEIGEYLKKEFWDDVITKDFDIIIFNLEDEFELTLMLYLKDLYKNNQKFLNSIINIIYNPMNAMLLDTKDEQNNIILSEKLVGHYVTQNLFNNDVFEIFNEITQTKGNEFYILGREYIDINYIQLKNNLLESDMIYIGAFKDKKFILNCASLEDVTHIVVLARGKS